jgi:hypothetical protein
MKYIQIFLVINFILLILQHGLDALEVIYALNAGGDSFTDSNGIRYRRDYLTEGTPSDYGKSLDIKRVQPQDKILYQTERYHTESFSYNIPMPSGDGDYVLWLKFSEVWFNAPNLKVFDVALNDDIVVRDLDIFGKVGRGVAHDEIIPFQVRQNRLIVNGKGSNFNNEIKVEFVKTEKDNPKVNAIVLVKGTPDQIPQLLPYQPNQPNKYDEFDDEEKETASDMDKNEEEEDESDENERIKRMQKQRMEDENNERVAASRKSKVYQQEPPTPVVSDPYASDETSYIIPILVSIGAFIPLLFCLCKL